jgi:HlyD family secretion protein/Biotin-lipoyl like
MKKSFILLSAVCILQLLCSCKTKTTSEEGQIPFVSVKATPLIKGDIESEISFNGSTVYLKRNLILSPISGYVSRVNVKYGDEVQKNEVLFEIQTRERKALESNSSSGEFGNIEVRSTSGGFVKDLTVNEPGVYVSEGGTLCNIVDIKDLMVRVNVPFEYNNVLTKRRKCTICLTDKTIISGSVSRILPEVDEVNQTQTVLIRPDTNRQLPENLNLIIKFLSENHQQVFLVSKSSLITNETQSEFWIMKIENGNMAVKIPVLKGIENDSIVEIISSQLKLNDLVISEGAYGMPDSTKITISR